MQRIGRLLSSLIILAGFIVIGWFGGWWDGLRPQKPAAQTIPKTPTPNLLIDQTQLIGWDNGQKTWEIHARKIWQENEGNIIYFEGISQGVIFTLRERLVNFNAGWARFEKFQNQLKLGGGISARIDEGTLHTAEATMDFGKQEMLCREEVRFEGKDILMQAARIMVDFEKDELDLAGDVELFQKNIHLKAGGLLYHLKDETYQLVKPEGVTLDL